MKDATITFEDLGQDFLEWDIEQNVVTGCRPFQGSVWCGTTVLNRALKVGNQLRISGAGGVGRLTLNYRVIKIAPLKPAAKAPKKGGAK